VAIRSVVVRCKQMHAPMRDPMITLPTMASERKDDPWRPRETERIPKVPHNTSNIGMSSVVHGVIDGVRQIRRDEHLVGCARWVLRGLSMYVALVNLRRPDAEGYLVDLFSALTQLQRWYTLSHGGGLLGSSPKRVIQSGAATVHRIGQERIVAVVRTSRPPTTSIIIRAASIVHVVCRQFAPSTPFFSFPDSLRARRARPLPEFISLFFMDPRRPPHSSSRVR
jgi:hypothetical protein